MATSRRRSTAIAITLGVCGLVMWQAKALPDREGAVVVHRAIREAAAAIPERSGRWFSVVLPTTESAVKLLKPNVLEQRRWTDGVTGRSVSVLLVHCGDTRDILGHYPPVCYPGQGWRLAATHDWEMTLGGRKYQLPEYEFVAVRGSSTVSLSVRNAMLLPGVGLGRDMDDVVEAARNVSRRFMGAGQIQVIFHEDTNVEERDRLTAEMIEIYRPVLETLARAKTSEEREQSK